MSPVIIVGAGISGLATAYFLEKAGIDVLLLEKTEQPGGTIRSARHDGWLIESGPNSALETTPLFKQIFSDLRLDSELMYANPAAANRYIVKNAALQLLPFSPMSMILSNLFSFGGKLRVMKEPFVGKAMKPESVAEFVERRLGKEFLDYAINPFVAGVYAGDPRQLSIREAFPKLYALEERYGGLIRGMIRGRRDRKQRGEVAKDRAKLFSFRSGMEVLPRAIAAAMKGAIHYGAVVDRVIPMRAGKYPMHTVSYLHAGGRQSVESRALVLTSPAYSTAEIIRSIDPEFARTLDSIYYPPVAEVFLGFTEEQLGRPLDGFGFLVPEVERRNILGCIWSSSLFPGRAPEGGVALTVFVGGARQPQLVSSDDGALLRVVMAELESLVATRGVPVFNRITRWEKAIPQYNVGYAGVLNSVERFEQNFQGTFICSNYRGGISVGDCLTNAEVTARRVQEHLHRARG